METRIRLDILPQPDDTTCGPTCLHAVYRYYRDGISLPQVIREVTRLEDGGTLAVWLGVHALKNGYDAKLYTYNLKVFDPTWFKPGVDIRQRLEEQLKHKRSPKLRAASRAYAEFLELGGKIIGFQDLTPALIRKYLKQQKPILTGLSATYLYAQSREIGDTNQPDDVRGEPAGHFVVLCGYDVEERSVLIADPYRANPVAKGHLYELGIDRVITAILLGVLTYDGNLLVIEPKAHHTHA